MVWLKKLENERLGINQKSSKISTADSTTITTAAAVTLSLNQDVIFNYNWPLLMTSNNYFEFISKSKEKKNNLQKWILNLIYFQTFHLSLSSMNRVLFQSESIKQWMWNIYKIYNMSESWLTLTHTNDIQFYNTF